MCDHLYSKSETKIRGFIVSQGAFCPSPNLFSFFAKKCFKTFRYTPYIIESPLAVTLMHRTLFSRENFRHATEGYSNTPRCAIFSNIPHTHARTYTHTRKSADAHMLTHTHTHKHAPTCIQLTNMGSRVQRSTTNSTKAVAILMESTSTPLWPPSDAPW